MVVSQTNALERCGLVIKDQTFGFSIASTNIGRLMARYYVSFESIKVFWQLQGNESLLDVFNTIISCREFSEFTLRVSDKKGLNEINNHLVRFPIKGKIKTSQNKISCLIQAVFDNVHIQDPSMVQDAHRMVRIGEKLSKCLFEYVRLSGDHFCGKVYKTFVHSIIVSKCFKAGLWNNTQLVSKQLKNIGPVYSSLFVNAGKTTIQSICETDPRRIEMILGKAPPFGDQIIEMVSSFPQYDMKLIRKSENYLEITIVQRNKKFNYEGLNAMIVAGDADNNLLFFNAKVDQTICEQNIFRQTFPIKDRNTAFVQAKLIHESLVGVDIEDKLVLNPDDELVNSKHIKSKAPSKSRTATKKITKYLTKKTNEEDNAIKALLDNDEDFDNIDIQTLEHSSLENQPRVVHNKNVSGYEKSAVIERALPEITERQLRCFEYIPTRKLSNSEIAPAEMEHSSASISVNAVNDSIFGEQISDKDTAGNEIMQQLFESEHQQEENFINSQISKYVAVECYDNVVSTVDGNGSVELKMFKYSGQFSAEEDKINGAGGIPNEKPRLRICTNVDEVSIISDKQNESVGSFDNQLVIDAEQSQPSSKFFIMTPGSLSSAQSSPRQNMAFNCTSNCNTKEQTSSLTIENGPNLSKLKYFHSEIKRLPCRSLIPAARSISSVKGGYQNINCKCSYFKDKVVKFELWKNSREIGSGSSDAVASSLKNLKNPRVTPSSSKSATTIFENFKLNQCKVRGDHIKSVFNKLCNKYLEKENVNSNTKDFLKKIEDELCPKIETNTEDGHKISEFLNEIAADRAYSRHNTSNQPNAEKYAPVVRQPLFKNMLPMEKPQHRRVEKISGSVTNPENERIDKLLENVIQERRKHIAPTTCNPYRMKIPRRQSNVNVGYAFRQNFEYFENLKRKGKLTELNRTFSNQIESNKTYLSEMSRVMFADRKKAKLGRGTKYLNIALPKPDFESIEKEQLKRSIVAEIAGEWIPSASPAKKSEGYIDAADNVLKNFFEINEHFNYENVIDSKRSEQNNLIVFDENSSQVESEAFFQNLSFVSPSNFSGNRGDPASQPFEPLSLLNDTEDDDTLLNYVQMKLESTQQQMVDLITPDTGCRANTSSSVNPSYNITDKFDDDMIF